MSEKKLWKIGIIPNISGYYFILDACEYLNESKIKIPSRIRICSELYPYIARKRNTTPSRVERTIRYAIQKSYASGKLKKVYNKCPTNKVFLFDFNKNYI